MAAVCPVVSKTEKNWVKNYINPNNTKKMAAFSLLPPVTKIFFAFSGRP
jgi:hypothetical protein